MSEIDSELEDFEGEEGKFIGEYIGERSEDGKRDGKGRSILPNRDQYDGEYRKGLRNGRGIYQYKCLAQYEGEWKKGLKHGNGKMNYPDGSWYCGEWKKGNKEGFGKYCYENNDFYEGTWKNNLKHGVGVYKYNEADISFRATWIEGILKGPIEIFFKQHRYHGYWNNDRPIGEGTFSTNMKYLLNGFISMIPCPFISQVSTETIKSFDTKTQYSTETRCVPVFVPNEIQRYKVCNLPQQPMPLPREDSVASICTQSSLEADSRGDVFKIHSQMLIAAESVEFKPTTEFKDG